MNLQRQAWTSMLVCSTFFIVCACSMLDGNLPDVLFYGLGMKNEVRIPCKLIKEQSLYLFQHMCAK